MIPLRTITSIINILPIMLPIAIQLLMDQVYVKSLKQISEDIKKAKKQLEAAISQLSIPALTDAQNLGKKNITIQKLINVIPAESKLKQMLEYNKANIPDKRYIVLQNYKGDYQLIKKINFSSRDLKIDAQKMYYLVAELGLEKVKSGFSQLREQGKIRLKCMEVFQDKNNRPTRYERNMISPNYAKYLLGQEDKDSIVASNPNISLQDEEVLVTVAYYESLNGQKQNEFICHGEQTLLELAKQFYCLISFLGTNQKTQNHHEESYFLIEENFYFNGSNTRKKVEQIIKLSRLQIKGEFYPGNQISVKSIPQKVEMGKIQLKNIRVVFGRPYMFRHLGGCDHTIIFKDMKLYNACSMVDPSRKLAYPLCVYQSKMKRRKCEGCKTRFSSAVSLADPLKNGKTLYLCEVCHKNMHPDKSSQEKNNVFVKYVHD